MSDRARDVFRMVVEAYLESGQPVGSRTLARLAGAQPVARLDPQRDAGSGGDRAARGAAHLGRAGADRERPAPVRRRRSCRSPSRAPRTGRRSRRWSTAAGRSRRRSATPPRRSPACPPAPASCWCPRRSRRSASSPSCRSSPRQAVAVLVGSDGSVENRVVDLPPGVTPATLAEVGNYVSRAPLRPDPARGAGAAGRGDPRRRGGARQGGAGAGRARPRALVARTARAGRC